MPASPDTTPSPYRLGDEIGRGALATVFAVRGPDGHVWAGKMLHESRATDATASERFSREAELVRGLKHPNVVELHGMEIIGGREVLLMELVEGPTLAERVARDAPLPEADVIALARGIAAGLAAAHRRGVIHRDLKPANILVAPGDVPKIADFGMARASSFAGIERHAFAVLGTPDYMAPEATDPLAVDARSDLYALGCIMFEMATGAPPYGGATAFGVLEQHRSAPIPPVPPETGLRPGLASLISSLLAKSPGDRPQNANAVVARLDGWSEGGSRAPLARLETGAVVPVEGACARCGAPTVPALGMCLACKLPLPAAQPGPFTIFITGPGPMASKMDNASRQRLLDWLAANPSLEVDPKHLRKKLPRFPFAFVTGVNERSASVLIESLAALGFRAEACEGGVTSLPAVRKKARVIGGRASGIVLGSTGYLMAQGWSWASWALPAWIALTLGAFAWFAGGAVRAATRRTSTGDARLPEALEQRLPKIARIGSELRERRHRDALRAIVSRTLALHRSVGADAALEDELGQALDIALVAAAKLDELDATLARENLEEIDARVHATLRERDLWSTRLLDLTATLDALRLRLAASRARKDAAADAEALEDLRRDIEALDEVQNG